MSSQEILELGQRLAERFATKNFPQALLTLAVPRDTTLNLARVLDGELTLFSRGDRLLVAIAVAYSQGSQQWLPWLKDAAASTGKSSTDIEAAGALALTCSTYNGYYKYQALMNAKESSPFQPALRATPFVQSPFEKVMIELICIAVSVQNSCSHCVQGHTQAAKEAGATDQMIDEVVRIGAVIGALALAE